MVPGCNSADLTTLEHKHRKELIMVIRSLAKTLFLFLFLWTTGFTLHAQTIAGIKFGLSLPDVSPANILVVDNGVNYYNIHVEDERYGIHAGIFLQSQMGHFFIQPELLYNSSTINYGLDSLYAAGSGTDHFTDTYRSLDLPFILGFKAGVLRLGAGPVGHLLISDESGFDGYYGYQSDFEDFTWGWQGGIGFDFWKLHFDFRYERNYSKLGDHLTFFGQPYDFATDNNRFIGSMGLSF